MGWMSGHLWCYSTQTSDGQAYREKMAPCNLRMGGVWGKHKGASRGRAWPSVEVENRAKEKGLQERRYRLHCLQASGTMCGWWNTVGCRAVESGRLNSAHWDPGAKTKSYMEVRYSLLLKRSQKCGLHVVPKPLIVSNQDVFICLFVFIY